jgi:DNA-binding GntR family transcriptional regulator
MKPGGEHDPDVVAGTSNARRTLPREVEIARQLIDDIIELRHPPGCWLREQELATQFGVSRSPVREALRLVAKAGFVQMRPWRGAQVVELTAVETGHILDVLQALYGVVARVAAETFPAERLPELRRILDSAAQLTAPGEGRERVRIAFAFGQFLGRWGANRVAYDALVAAGNLALWQHRFFASDDLVQAARSLTLHHVLFGSIEARDPATAEVAARSIVALARQLIVPQIAAARPKKETGND